MANILVIGATSLIAEHCARLWAARGARLFLVARDAGKLAAVAADLRVRGAEVATAVLDADHLDRHAATLDAAAAWLDGIDIALIAHGVLSDQKACEASVSATLASLTTNGISVVAMATDLANRMEARGRGTLAVISSVAGDRGRRKNYVYGSSKALISAFLQGLRNRLASKGVHVLTIKPGPVDTPMGANVPDKGPLWARPDKVAAGIVAAIDRGRNVVYLPWFWWPVMRAVQSLPEAVFKRLKL
ncbi:MAG: SDR family oxidoreductase [Rhodospirillales bacterium]|nr:MAG: SDR family oxidoreductase [Rhodospirillales bacterium]